jgi:hypothetical protein
MIYRDQKNVLPPVGMRLDPVSKKPYVIPLRWAYVDDPNKVYVTTTVCDGCYKL